MLHNPSRRDFFKKTGIATSAMALSALSYSRVYAANERLHVASIGTGGKGWSDLNLIATSPAVHVTAICDIDSSKKHLGQAADKFPQARQYADWRELLDAAKDIDSVIVSTPDFMHAAISLPAMQLGKHVYCQKPLTHTLFESRQMRSCAEKYRVVTQMGNQIQSHEAYRTAVKIVHEGLIGKVREVHSWQAGSPSWRRAIERPSGTTPVPSHIRWDLWQGVAEERPYLDELYHPFNWRGWQSYGTGQLGDFGCHILDPVFKSLQLTAPIQLMAEAPKLLSEKWTDAATVYYEFPGTEFTTGDRLPVTWYDAVGVTPPRNQLKDIPTTTGLPSAGSVLVGETGSLLIPHYAMPKLYPEEKFKDVEVPKVEGVDHYVQFADACRGADQTTSHFDYASQLTETVLLGTVAIRFPGEWLKWNANELRFTNSAAANERLSKPYRKGWEPSWV